MAGDHKCPVCQATFTRPQHVARHMRSHTGDRPYKCQYCGDQFARSDLLSRHVNKCHANEKPLPSTGARRKGATGASRATTSKQACDQCVTSSLPCDGCNPCAKCISRKSRCTYVKFHRQTAPIGPGHSTRTNASSSALSVSLPPPSSLASSSRLQLYHQADDDFILGPAPSNLPSMADALYQSNTFAFPPLYPSNAEVASLPDGTADYASKYRAQQAELFGPGRSGLGTGLTPLYDPRPGSSASTSSWMSGWDGQDSHESYPNQASRQTDYVSIAAPSASTMHDKQLPATLHQQSNVSGHFIGSNPPNSVGNPLLPYDAGYPLPGMHGSSSSSPPPGHTRNSSGSYSSSRRGSGDFSGSDVSGSVPSSASASSTHLPLPGATLGFGNNNFSLGNIPSKHRHTTNSNDRREYDRFPPNNRHAEFDAAFGLMSLDDPAVLAGTALDSQPFFADPAQAHNRHAESSHDGLLTADVGADLDTPMPMKRGAGQLHMPAAQRPSTSTGVPPSFTPSGNLVTPPREPDTKELKDFWRQYMRTPLTGPQDSGILPNNSSLSPSKMNTTPVYRRQRVSSLPSAKTPMLEKGAFIQDRYANPDPRARDAGATSSMRTTLHGNEDLSSYEAAVMARKAPAMMNLQLKRPAKSKTGAAPPQQRSQSERHSASASPQLGGPSNQDHTSSLAGALGNRLGGILYNPNDESPPSLTTSRDTSVDSDGASDAELRPSFKRLPSQTLGPENTKRAFLGYDDDLDDRERSVGWVTGAPDVKPAGLHLGGMAPMSHPDRVVASIAERRRRRMSAPGGSPPKNLERNTKPHEQTPEVAPLGYAPAPQGGANN